MKKQYTAVLFDLDGTLLNTLEDLTAAVNHTMREMGYPLRTMEEIRKFVGDGMIRLLKRSLPDGRQDESTVSEAFSIFSKYYKEHFADFTKPYQGMQECVRTLQEAGIAVGVVSNKDEGASVALCERFFGKDAFKIVLGRVDDRPKKPAPDGVLLALNTLGVAPLNALYVGDSDVDFMTAKNANVDCALVSWGFRKKEELCALAPAAVVDGAAELISFVL